ncbi:uncharacterized protein YGR130C-like [Impatiens glandulifera]|uniref:uncharacterized protein YGR130C-like n=1 Tax=Impatiens glandulifera TaxID=253017 RepID=UPI001FB06943|nr:uncharacterized protein YGR130C-like [Impatiens glandulifera]
MAEPIPSRQTESSGSHETMSKSKEIPAIEVSIHSQSSKSPTKTLNEVIDNIGLRTSEVIENVVQNVNHETEDDVTSLLQNTDQVGATGQTTINLAEEAVNSENIIPPAREGSNEEKQPSGSVWDKSVSTGSNSQAAQDGPSNPFITPEGPSQVSKGKEVMIEDTPVQELTLDAEVPISEEEEEAMFQEFIRDMNKEADEIAAPYHLWVRLRCETKLSDMIPDFNGNEYWLKLLQLEQEALKITGTEVIQAAYAKTETMEEYFKLKAVDDTLKNSDGNELTPMELKLIKRFQGVRDDLTSNVHRLKFQSRPIFKIGESSKSAGNGQEGPQQQKTENEDNRGKFPSQTNQNLGFEQIKGVIIDTITSSLNEYNIATDAKNSTIQADLVETVWESIHAEIVETVQTSIKTTIDKSVEMATAPLLEMMQAMAAQIKELTKLQAARTQEQIRLDAETARRIQTEEEDKERLRKETEDNDLKLAKKIVEDEQAAQPKPTPIQAPHSMVTRIRGKRKKITNLLKLVEQSGIECSQPVGQSEEPLDEEKEEDVEQLNRRKKKAVKSSIASPSLGPTIDQTPDHLDQRAVSSGSTNVIPVHQVSLPDGALT